MKAATKLLAGVTLAALAISAPIAQSATTYSSVLGYYTLDIPEGKSAWAAGLTRKKVHQGVIASYVGVAASATEPAKTSLEILDRDLSSLDLSNHYVEILDEGDWSGLILDIDQVSGSSGTSLLTVVGDIALVTNSEVSQTASICIREHNTFASLFPNGGGFEVFRDTVALFDDEGIPTTFRWNGSVWFASGISDATDEKIYPGQAFFVDADDERAIVIGGGGVSYVKDTPTLIPLNPNVINLVGAINPLVGDEVPISTFDLTNVMSQFADRATLFSSDGEFTGTTYRRNGSVLFRSGSSDASADPVDVSAAFYLQPDGVKYWQSPAVNPADIID